MSTTPLTDAINALTQYANETTGQSDTTLSDAVGTLVAGYGGGGGGGLANMVDVSDGTNVWGYMLSQMKNGNTAGGTVTYSQAFANTEQLILSTGLTQVHGFLFVCPTDNPITNLGTGQTNKMVFVWFFDNGGVTQYSIVAFTQTTTWSYANGRTMGTAYNGAPENGTIRISGGDIYYTARYNKNANYQIIRPNVQYEWLAW